MAKALSQIVTQQSKMLLATGQSQTETAKQLGISRKSVNRLAQKYKAEIEQLTFDIISESIPLIRDNHIGTLQWAKDIVQSRGNKAKRKAIDTALSELGLSPGEVLKLSDTKEHRALKIMGIAPANTPSMIVNMLFAGKDAQDSVEELESVKGYLEYKRSQDVQEAEFSEVEDTSEP